MAERAESASDKKLETALGSLMSAQEYSELHHDTPYIFTLESGGKSLFYFGTQHVGDPKNPLLQQILKAFEEFKPDFLIIEGTHKGRISLYFESHVRKLSYDDLIHQHGESGPILQRALNEGIGWDSPEPTGPELYTYLENQGFSRDQIFTWDVLRILPQYHRGIRKDGFEKYLDSFRRRFVKETKWEGYDYSYDHALQLIEKQFGKIDVEVNELLDSTDPIPWKDTENLQTFVNRVAQSAGEFRDKRIIAGIASSLKKHNRVFILYGASHAVMQEPSLRKLFE